MGPSIRRIGVAAVLATTTIGGLLTVAPPARAGTRAFGLYDNVGRNDVNTHDERVALAARVNLVTIRGTVGNSLCSPPTDTTDCGWYWIDDLHNLNSSLVALDYDTTDALSPTEAADHPEWVAKDCNGKVITATDKQTTLADVTNPAFRAWREGNIRDGVNDNHYDGAFIDVVAAYYPLYFYTGKLCYKGSPVSDSVFAVAMASFLSEMKLLISPKLVIANGFGLGTGAAYYQYAPRSTALVNAADGVQIEGFTRWGKTPIGQYNTTSRWSSDLKYLKALGKWTCPNGSACPKIALAYTKVDAGACGSTDCTAAQLTTVRDYALGEFLLGFRPDDRNPDGSLARRYSYFSFGDGLDGLVVDADDKGWGAALDLPGGKSVKTDCGVYYRPFAGGRDAVNPSGNSLTCTLAGIPSKPKLAAHSVLVTDTAGTPL